MCCCETPNINGQPGYRWQPTDPPSIRPVHPPSLDEWDELLYDEPGRCGGGIDSHAHHYRLVKRSGSIDLLVENGSGRHRIRTAFHKQVDFLAALDSNTRYWIFNAIYHAHGDGERNAREKTHDFWRRAAAEKRIKTRKLRDGVKVWVEDPT